MKVGWLLYFQRNIGENFYSRVRREVRGFSQPLVILSKRVRYGTVVCIASLVAGSSIITSSQHFENSSF